MIDGENTNHQDQESGSDGQESSESTDDQNRSQGQSSGRTYDEAYVQRLRTEAAGYRTRVRDLEAATQTKEQQLESRVKELETAASTLSRENRRYKLVDELSNEKYGVRHPRALARMIDLDTIYDEQGNLINLDRTLKDLKSEAPSLFIQVNGSGDGDRGLRGNNRGTVTMNDIIRRSAGR